jgi:hypothetical protein
VLLWIHHRRNIPIESRKERILIVGNLCLEYCKGLLPVLKERREEVKLTKETILYLLMCSYVRVYIEYVCTYVLTHILCTYEYVCICVYTHIRIYVCVYVGKHVHIYIYIYIYICVSVDVYIYMYVCKYACMIFCTVCDM